MAKPQTVRFASGTPEAPFSGVWRMIANKNDVYIGASKATMSVFTALVIMIEPVCRSRNARRSPARLLW
jgi:hypothetical protein